MKKIILFCVSAVSLAGSAFCFGVLILPTLFSKFDIAEYPMGEALSEVSKWWLLLISLLIFTLILAAFILCLISLKNKSKQVFTIELLAILAAFFSIVLSAFLPNTNLISRVYANDFLNFISRLVLYRVGIYQVFLILSGILMGICLPGKDEADKTTDA